MIRDAPVRRRPRLGAEPDPATGRYQIDARIVSATAADGTPLDTWPGLDYCPPGEDCTISAGLDPWRAAQPGQAAPSSGTDTSNLGINPWGPSVGNLTVPDFFAKYKNAILWALVAAGVLFVAVEALEARRR